MKDETSEYYVIEPCTSSNGIEVKLKDKKINLKKAAKVVERTGVVVGQGPVVLLGKMNGCVISIYASGRMMLKECKTDIKKVAREIADRLIKEGAIE